MAQRLVAVVLGFLCAALLASCERPAPIAISIIYGTEKQSWLEPLIHEYNESQTHIQVRGIPSGSLQSFTTIIDEIDTPTVWAPASSIYLPIAEEEWRLLYDTNLIDGEPKSLVLSPVVIAMWRAMAETLGWPDNDIGWGAIARLSTSPQGWAEYGRSEWGEFKLGHTHPEYSNSGLLSILALAYAAAGKQTDLTPADLANPEVRTFIRSVLTSISHYGSSTGSFAERMFDCERGGSAYLSAAILYENLVVMQERRRQQGAACTAANEPVVAIYPVEGTFWNDNPYIVLNAPWISDAQKQAARQFADFLLAEPQQARAMQLGFRPANPATPLVSPLDEAHGVDPTLSIPTFENPSIEVIREIQRLWATS
jgi:Ca-activated chloride channel family protein